MPKQENNTSLKITNWINAGANYSDGVKLYGELPGCKPNLLRLFLKKKNTSNASKLKYELGKLCVSVPGEKPALVTKKTSNSLKVNPQVDFIKVDSKTAKSHTQGFYKINELHADLHPLAIKQRSDFQTAISLHEQLIKLHPDEEGVALDYCIRIEDLFDAIETAQRVLDHYVEHKVVLNIAPRNYSQYTGGQLADARRNKRTSVTKYKKKVSLLKQQLGQNLSKSEKTKVLTKLEKAEDKMLQHELELQELNELINNPKSTP